MFCRNCGAEIAEASRFCKKCGAPVDSNDLNAHPNNEQQTDGQQYAGGQQYNGTQQQYNGTQYGGQYYPPYTPQPKPKTGLVGNIVFLVISFICGLVLGLPTAIAGLVLSIIATSAVGKGDMEKAEKFAKLGRIFMWITLGLIIVNLVLVIIVVVMFYETIMQTFATVPQDQWTDAIEQLLQQWLEGNAHV